MPEQLTYPGVYVEEVPSGVRTIIGVATSITAFVGRTKKGPTDATLITGYPEFVSKFGGLWSGSKLPFAVRDFYLNGGRLALICRLYAQGPGNGGQPPDGRARLTIGAAGDTQIALVASSPGAWGNELRATVDHKGLPPGGELFNLTVVEDLPGGQSERFAGLSLYADRQRNIHDVLEAQSVLIQWDDQKQLLAAPGAGAARVGPPDGSDPTSQLEQQAAGSAKAGKDTARGAVTAAATETAATAAKSAAAQKLAQAQADKKAKDDASTAAQTAEQDAQTALDAANKAVTDAQALDQTDPANQQKLKAAKDDQQAKQGAYDSAQKAAADAAAAAQQAQAAFDNANTASTNADKAAAAAAAAAKTASDDATKSAGDAKAAQDAAAAASLGGDDGAELDPQAFSEGGAAEQSLGKADLFNLLCIPPYKSGGNDVEPAVYDWAAAYAEKRRAVLLVDPPSSWGNVDAAVSGFRDPADVVGGRSSYSALYFPRLKQPNPLTGDAVEEFVPCGAVAGVIARTDANRGVWKAPAGLEATLTGVPDLTVRLNDDENGELNPLGINCLRAFPIFGRVIWGARTLQGADVLASDWKYLPIRRLALYLEESLYRGTQWVVFEPNDEPLWAQIRLSVGSFMHEQFRQGAFQGRTPQEAYFVKCDAETTTQADRDRGIVNILVGFAPLKPAEFVVIRLQQIAGTLEV